MKLTSSIAAIAGMIATPLFAQTAQPVAPKLIVAIAVDQLSADLFAEYRGSFTGGFKRLADQGAVFPAGYQAMSATETCPGHSTILTGSYPARSGIIANGWIDLGTAREDKSIYCAEDESVPGSTSSKYTVSPVHLKVPTLGMRMKAANPASRNVAVSGKDRGAVMMAGRDPDQIWWWSGEGFVSYPGKTSPVATQVNTAVAQAIATSRQPLALTPSCQQRARPFAVGARTVGDGRFARDAGDKTRFRASPELDGATLALAAGLVQEMKLGQASAPDLLSVSVSATDYVGHGYGTEGSEMCLQLEELDRSLGDFFARLDATGVDYAVVLTADHGGLDLPERAREQGAAESQRVTEDLAPKAVSARVGAVLGLSGELINGDGAFGDMWVSRALSAADKARVVAEAKKQLSAHPQVQGVFTHADIMAVSLSRAPVDSWTLVERLRASYDPARSGDYVVVLKPRVTPIPASRATSYVATHGSIWDYDRRVPILFWRKGMAAFEQPLAISTVDIMPTLASLISLPVALGEIDGVCRDLDAGTGTTCR